MLVGDLLETLTALDPGRPFALFLRHAERAPIPPDAPFADVDLIEAGAAQARALGQHLLGRLSWAAVSPWQRCRRTATLMTDAPAKDDTRLGAPGPWVLDEHQAARLFSELGTEGVVRAQIAGQRWPFLRSAAEGTHLLLRAARDRLEAGRGSGICISHDAVLIPAIAALTGERFENTWLVPLDGFAVQPGERGLVLLWRGQRRELPPW